MEPHVSTCQIYTCQISCVLRGPPLLAETKCMQMEPVSLECESVLGIRLDGTSLRSWGVVCVPMGVHSL